MIPLVETRFNIVLYEPEIPANTGNIGRLCVGTGSKLHIIQPCKFLITDKTLKRAGLDYWEHLDLTMHKTWEEILEFCPLERVFFCTTKSKRNYLNENYQYGDTFVFGPESRGLPQNLLDKYPERLITIPMHPLIRSINLANSVAIILYEAIRQVYYSS
ncbi:MAG TPA: tRNA (cytidine(34)-2'-O)-methyltransferase [Candidatus Syntrophosphaera thermopropionivorans]|jgi:tRNA (cytidine/uridine-2'-O-)-methyltransferase|nr:tRNA (cytidine(34)-2'-O)-methyltransferase [Candidatus Syntrophosphaera thermopropionivorans]HOR29799.1 tRNA (cytidine(34)-2'-O)-methyltransferase [Candidatus Syntrophosphaera thermopropionivorans]